MKLQDVKKLESEVRGLQHLMQEVHRNQLVLNRALLNGGICSRSKIEDPKKAEGPGAEVVISSLEGLQAPRPQPQTEERREEGKRRKSNSPSQSASNQKTREFEEVSNDTPKGKKEMVRPEMEGLHPGSSFIRNILDEDSRAGIAVVDLFVTVKMAKDNLRFLSRSNSEVFDKINYLKKETVAIGVGYKDLLEEMRSLLGRMNETLTQKRKSSATIRLLGEKNKVKFWNHVEERILDEVEGQTSTSTRNSEDETAKVECIPDEAGIWGKSKRGRTKGGCVGCFVSAHKAVLFQELPELSEASLASFMATLLWMQKGQQRFCETCEGSSSAAPRLECEGKPKLSDSAYRMFCDICDVLDGAAREDLGSDQTETEEGLVSRTGGRRGRSPAADHSGGVGLRPASDYRPNCIGCRRKHVRSRRSARSLRREASESESEIEDAASARPLTGLGLRAKPSVTCMGDLTRAVPGKKSASTLTTASNCSHFRKLSGGIRSKMKRIRSKKNIKKEEVKLSKCSKKFPGMPGPKMKEGPSAHELSALCHKPCVKRGLGAPGPWRMTTPVHTVLASNATGSFPSAFDDPGDVDYMSDDSFYNCDSESVAAGSHSGDEDLEEFVEIFNKSSKPGAKASAAKSFLGLLHETTLKTIKALFFEIQKCYPANFVQEILPKTVEAGPKESSDASITLSPGESKQKRVVIEGSSTDFVLYIQVELDEGSRTDSREVLVHRQSSSSGTQTRRQLSEGAVFPEERAAESEEEDGHHDVWEECEGSHQGVLEERETNAFDEPPAIAVRSLEREIRNTFPVESNGKAKKICARRVLVMKNEKKRADIWLLQNSVHRVYSAVGRNPSGTIRQIVEVVDMKPPELEKALNLIREIENDVVDVKLSDAISILPRLEWELRKHVQSKLKRSGEKEAAGGIETFFPSVDFWPPLADPEKENARASERMQNLLTMLSELESAIRATESNVNNLRQYDSSKVYDLLRALVGSIRGLEGNASMSNLSQTLDIASQLDTAVREYDSIIKKRPLDHSNRGGGRNRKRNAESVEPMPAKQHLKNVRKKVFETVEDEATRLERRVEKSLARLSVLEKENDEVMTFLEAFLQKTKRRMSELTNLKSELKKLSTSLRDMYDNLNEKTPRKCSHKKERKASAKAGTEEVPRGPQVPQVARSLSETNNSKRLPQPSNPTVTVLRETVSGLLFALDSLKSRAREKKELCREIFSPPASEKAKEPANSSRRSSRSSFTAKHPDTLTSSLKAYRKIDENRLYLEWTNPKGSLKDFVSGFEIYVNGKLNQKVRNPRRLQAILYSVNFTETVNLELYAIVENHPKILLISELRQED